MYSVLPGPGTDTGVLALAYLFLRYCVESWGKLPLVAEIPDAAKDVLHNAQEVGIKGVAMTLASGSVLDCSPLLGRACRGTTVR